VGVLLYDEMIMINNGNDDIGDGKEVDDNEKTTNTNKPTMAETRS
jgi:hypothetical protein